MDRVCFMVPYIAVIYPFPEAYRHETGSPKTAWRANFIFIFQLNMIPPLAGIGSCYTLYKN